jgi:hypothetical protein
MASSDFDLEAHIDYSHSDIFRTSEASSATRDMKTEQVIVLFLGDHLYSGKRGVVRLKWLID